VGTYGILLMIMVITSRKKTMRHGPKIPLSLALALAAWLPAAGQS
jgi:hypothetical protein